MTCKIERQADEHHTTLRLIGYLHAAHLEALQAHMEGNGPRTALDLDEVTMVERVWRTWGLCRVGHLLARHGGFHPHGGAPPGLSGGGMMPALLSEGADYPQHLHALRTFHANREIRVCVPVWRDCRWCHVTLRTRRCADMSVPVTNGVCSTHKEQINEDVLAFIKS
jgi:hypothetical protein